jgi:hypothetical protein
MVSAAFAGNAAADSEAAVAIAAMVVVVLRGMADSSVIAITVIAIYISWQTSDCASR